MDGGLITSLGSVRLRHEMLGIVERSSGVYVMVHDYSRCSEADTEQW